MSLTRESSALKFEFKVIGSVDNNNFFTNQNIKRNEGYLKSLKNDNV